MWLSKVSVDNLQLNMDNEILWYTYEYQHTHSMCILDVYDCVSTLVVMTLDQLPYHPHCQGVDVETDFNMHILLFIIKITIIIVIHYFIIKYSLIITDKSLKFHENKFNIYLLKEKINVSYFFHFYFFKDISKLRVKKIPELKSVSQCVSTFLHVNDVFFFLFFFLHFVSLVTPWKNSLNKKIYMQFFF